MWGIEFQEASNSLICGHAEFYVQHTRTMYRVRFHPDIGMALEKETDDGWEIIKNRASPEDIEAVLPQGDFGLKWTYHDFLVALTFFDEGHKRGYARGEWKANERHANRERAK